MEKWNWKVSFSFNRVIGEDFFEEGVGVEVERGEWIGFLRVEGRFRIRREIWKSSFKFCYWVVRVILFFLIIRFLSILIFCKIRNLMLYFVVFGLREIFEIF